MSGFRPQPWRCTVRPRTGTESLVREIDCNVGLGRFSLSGNRVTWHERVNSNWDIYVHDLASSVLTRVTTDPADQADPSIHGDLLVWSDRRHGAVWWDLYAYDFRTGTERRITQNTTLGRSPIVSSDKIVWGDIRGGFFRLYQYTLQGQPQELPVAAPLLENDLAASESGRYVAWVNRNDAGSAFFDDVFVHDFLTATTSRVTTHPARQFQPAITDEYIAWEDWRGGQPRVYILRLSKIPPP
jgi:beta propeller repeat protein